MKAKATPCAEKVNDRTTSPKSNSETTCAVHGLPNIMILTQDKKAL